MYPKTAEPIKKFFFVSSHNSRKGWPFKIVTFKKEINVMLLEKSTKSKKKTLEHY